KQFQVISAKGAAIGASLEFKQSIARRSAAIDVRQHALRGLIFSGAVGRGVQAGIGRNPFAANLVHGGVSRDGELSQCSTQVGVEQSIASPTLIIAGEKF